MRRRRLLVGRWWSNWQRYVPPYWVAMIYTGLGENDEALKWLEKAYEKRSIWLVWLKTDPVRDSLRSDPRFRDLLRRMNFSL